MFAWPWQTITNIITGSAGFAGWRRATAVHSWQGEGPVCPIAWQADLQAQPPTCTARMTRPWCSVPLFPVHGDQRRGPELVPWRPRPACRTCTSRQSSSRQNPGRYHETWHPGAEAVAPPASGCCRCTSTWSFQCLRRPPHRGGVAGLAGDSMLLTGQFATVLAVVWMWVLHVRLYLKVISSRYGRVPEQYRNDSWAWCREQYWFDVEQRCAFVQ